MAAKKSGGRKYGKAAGKRVESAMKRRKKGTLRSGGSGKKVTSRKQAIAIGLSEAREKGAKVPRKRGGAKKGGRKSASGGRKSSGRKSTGRKSTGRKTSGRKSTGRKSTARKSTARRR
jgi:Family of unknown function (DUF6496)